MYDRTGYAQSIGYAGTTPVIVCDGQVVTFDFMDWFEFCDECRRGIRAARYPDGLSKI